MKNKVLSLGFAALATAAQLSAAPQISNGAYVGAAAGVSVLGGKYNYSHSQNGAQQNNMAYSLSKTSPALSIFAGYGMKVSGFWAAAELFYQFDSLKNKQNPIIATDEKSISSKATGAYGAAVHLGFLPAENCVAYAILGVEARKFKVTFSDVPPVTMNTKINKSYTSVAFAPGIGARFALTKNLSVRTEYKYAMHRNKKLTDTADVPGGGAADTITVKHQPKVQTFNVGVVYNF